MALPRSRDDAVSTADATIAKSIDAWMAYRRVNQGEVAAAAGLTQPQLSRRLNGHTDFKASEVAAIAAFLDVAVGRLYEGLSDSGYRPDYGLHPLGQEQGELLDPSLDVAWNARPVLATV